MKDSNSIKSNTKSDWWTTFYDQNLADILLDPASGEEVQMTCNFLTEVLSLSPGDTIFDQCCGNGRLALELGLRDFSVIGIDQADIYIQQATTEATNLKSDCVFETADAFQYTTPTPCHAAMNWWTSFGYADEDFQNLKMLKTAYDSLITGGKFALDYMNTPNLYRTFQPSMITRRQLPSGELILLRESSIDSIKDVLHKKWTYYLPNDNGVVSHDSSTRLYTPAQLAQLFSQAGFTDIEFYGDVDQRPLSLHSPRCIVVATKPHS